MEAPVLYRIVYLSSAVGPITPAVLADILDRSRRNNKADGITGVLLYDEGNFIQVLEGPKDEVTACFDRILEDERNTGWIVLERKPVEARVFAGWDMGYIAVSDLPDDQRANFIDLSDLSHSDKMTEIEGDEMVAIFMKSFLRGVRATHAV